jgi:hypothetical protein
MFLGPTVEIFSSILAPRHLWVLEGRQVLKHLVLPADLTWRRMEAWIHFALLLHCIEETMHMNSSSSVFYKATMFFLSFRAIP